MCRLHQPNPLTWCSFGQTPCPATILPRCLLYEYSRRLGHHTGADLSWKSILDELEAISPDGPDWYTDRAQRALVSCAPVGKCLPKLLELKGLACCDAFCSDKSGDPLETWHWKNSLSTPAGDYVGKGRISCFCSKLRQLTIFQPWPTDIVLCSVLCAEMPRWSSFLYS